MRDATRWTLRTHVQTGLKRARCCDAAHAVERDGWHVLAVSDGVSSRGDSHFGAHLVSRVAAHTALKHLAAGGPFPHVPNRVQYALTGVLAAVHTALGPENAASALPCTLVLLVVGPSEAAAWFAGDGDASLVGIPTADANLATWTSDGDSQTEARPCRDPSRFTVHWRKRGPYVTDLPYQWVRPDSTSPGWPPGRPLQRAFHVVGNLTDVHGALVGTDGTPDVATDLLLERPVAPQADVAKAAAGATDDVGLAWGGPMWEQVQRDHIDRELAATLETFGLADGGVSNV